MSNQVKNEISEKSDEIVAWAHEVGATDDKADEILGQDDRNVHHASDIEKVMDRPEGVEIILDPIAEGEDIGSLHVLEFEPEDIGRAGQKIE